MLVELTIQDFAIIDRLRLTFGGGFNVMTGETGAGKSIIIDAVSLLLGGRALAEVVRTGTERALVEGLFELDAPRRAVVRPHLEEAGLWAEGGEEETLILTREINSAGRNLCRVNGRVVPLSLLRSVAAPLVDIHGQSEHLSLMNPRRHVDLLDRFAGTLGQRAQLAEKVARLRRVRETMTRLMRNETDLSFRVDRLSYVVDEVDAAALQPNEEEELAIERRRLSNVEKLSQFAEEAIALLLEGPDEERPSALPQATMAARAMAGLVRVDESMSETQNVLDQAVALLDDAVRSIARYRETLEFDPERMEEIERRLTLLFNLKRKYGETIPDILAARDAAQAELDEIAQAEEKLVLLRAREEELLAEIGTLGRALSAARRKAAARMAREVEQELADLRMERAHFDTAIEWVEEEGGAPVAKPFEGAPDRRFAFDATGLDRIEFLLAPNPGEGLKPLARIASGGEASRIMLAIKTALGHADDTPTLIFDEIDTGVGGRVGAVVGQKLHDLAKARQVLCITHLPQLAAFGDKHFHIQKVLVGERTATRIREMDDEGRIGELALMIGSGDEARTAAEAMLRQRGR